jgi:8-oxo-dGTP pyrophosphatase MutT (NUDIX family)
VGSPQVRYDAALRDRLRGHLDRHDRTSVTDPALRHAAVVVAVLAAEEGRDAGDRRDGAAESSAAFLLTRRASRLRAHRGQWAFPGGSLDPGEDAVTAALRELDEEVGMRDVEVLGLLDDYPSRSGYRITPVVVWAPPGTPVVPDPSEVASVHRVPLEVLDATPRYLSLPDAEGPVIQVPLAPLDTLLHAPSGAVLHQFAEVALHGRATRVAHLDAPGFARR